MHHRFLTRFDVLVVIIALSFVPAPVEGQASRAAAKANNWTPPRTPEGHPDLQGVWSYATLTPLERPERLAGQTHLTDADAAEIVKQAEVRRLDANAAAKLPPGQVGGYNQFWYEPGTSVSGDKRTALIVDPADGRIPPLMPEAQKRAAAHRESLRRLAEGPEDRDTSERCILGYNAGPPMTPGGYNQNVQLVQTPGYVLIHTEMVHNARIVPLDKRQHLPPDLRPWSGDSRGHWEGDTLVVDTSNFTDKTWNQFNRWNMASDENMHLVERFTRTGPDTLLYEFTIDDPTTWTKPWSAAVPLSRTDQLIYEYACHEGNYGMFGILRGARLQERTETATESGAPR